MRDIARTRDAWGTLGGLACLLVLGGCPQPQDTTRAERPPRPVTVMALEEQAPLQRLRLTGSVTAWKQVPLGFAVGGRLDWTLDEGDQIVGRTSDEEGRRIAEGTVVARLDPRRFELAVRVREADVRATRARAAALETQVKEVLAEERRAAQSDLERAEKDFKRYTDLVARGVAQQAQLDRSEGETRVLRAKVASVEAQVKAKQAELDSALAQLEQLQEAVRQARLDLEDTELRCPFDARVSELHAIPGAFVSPGQAVASVVMMDPVQVELVVSAETDRDIGYGDAVEVWAPGWGEYLEGIVAQKDTVANAATRTFTVDVMVRNLQVPDGRGERAGPEIPRIAGLTRVERGLAQGRSEEALFVDVRSLQPDGTVLRVQGRRNGPLRVPLIQEVERVAVTPGEGRIDLLGLTYRELRDPGGIEANDILVRGPASPDLPDGARVYVDRRRWLLRPGELVEVVLSHPDQVSGLHVPIEVIVREAGAQYVFVVEGEPGREVVSEVPVRILGSAGELKRIEGVGLAPGVRVVVEGAQLLVPGERVRILEPAGEPSRDPPAAPPEDAR